MSGHAVWDTSRYMLFPIIWFGDGYLPYVWLPKDSLLAIEKLITHSHQACLCSSLGENPSVNNKFYTQSTVTGERLKVTTRRGDEAAHIQWLSWWRLGVCLREGWWRVTKFVHLVVESGSMLHNGLSSEGLFQAVNWQYNYHIRFPVLKDKVSRIKADLEKLHASVHAVMYHNGTLATSLTLCGQRRVYISNSML